MISLQTIAFFTQSFHCRPYTHWFRGGFKAITGSECSNSIVRMRPERWLGRILHFANENMRPERIRVPASSSLESPSCPRSYLEATALVLGKESGLAALRIQVLPFSRSEKPPASLWGGLLFLTTFPWLPLAHRLLQDPPVSFKEQDFPSKHSHVVVSLSTALLCREWGLHTWWAQGLQRQASDI